MNAGAGFCATASVTAMDVTLAVAQNPTPVFTYTWAQAVAP